MKNIFDEQFKLERSNLVWCSDIIYIWKIDRFVYLTSIKDLYSEELLKEYIQNTGSIRCG